MNLLFKICACAILLTPQIPCNALPTPSELKEDQSNQPQTDFVQPNEPTKPQTPPAKPFEAFTGKIIKAKVRLRQQPNVESPIIKELNQGDLVVVVGESDDFYAVQPSSDVKAYVFRTYILDNVVEANRVNVRLEPDMDAPTIAQLNAGDKVNGTISQKNNKWLEIAPPPSARFYVSKDYVKKIGDASMMAALEQKQSEVNLLLNNTALASQQEMQKPFPEINLEPMFANYNKIITSYSDFPEQVARAKEQLKLLQDAYLQKKLSYLENKSKMTHMEWQNKNTQLNEQLKAQQEKLSQYEQIVNNPNGIAVPKPTFINTVNNKMAAWFPVEEELFNQWHEHNPASTQKEFYEEQVNNAAVINGVLEPYTRAIKNKPGDYVVINPVNHLPIAFVYSTQVNLQDVVGHQVNLRVSPRNNNNFAYPAYFVLSVQ
jgi:hypothetical protein